MLLWGIIHGLIVGVALLRNIFGVGFWAIALGLVLGCIIAGIYAAIIFMGIEYDFDEYDTVALIMVEKNKEVKDENYKFEFKS